MNAGITRIYLSGPMTGIPDLNFPLFNAQAARLRSAGFDVVNPAELNPCNTKPWHECMREDIKALCDCDAICLLPGWEKSSGAHLELHLAHRLGMEVLHADKIEVCGCRITTLDGICIECGRERV